MGKKLFIIDNEKESAYALLLLQLISAKDDNSETGEVVGIKDGSVDASLWGEKEYKDSRAKIVSSNKIMFVGLSDTSKAISKNIVYDKELSKWGIYIGWLGNIGVIYADPKILYKDKTAYDDFYNEYVRTFGEMADSETAQNITDKTEKTTEKVNKALNKGLFALSKGAHSLKNFGKKIINEVSDEKLELTEFSEEKVVKLSEKATNAIGIGGLLFVAPWYAAAGLAVAGTIKKAQNEKEINEQIYRYMIFRFYRDYLSKFMELDD